MNPTIPKQDWEWYGKPAHFICSEWCRFHMATKVGRFIVSTVGEYVHPRHGNGTEKGEAEWLKKNWPGDDIGHERKYETMVFLAGAQCADPKCNCGQVFPDGNDLDFRGYNSARDARAGHLELCEKWAGNQGYIPEAE